MGALTTIVVVSACGTGPTPAPTSSVASASPCAAHFERATPDFTRYEVSADSTWWVAYGSVRNPCDRPASVRIKAESVAGGPRFTGQVRGLPVQAGKPPALFWQDTSAGQPQARPLLVPAESDVVVAAKITVPALPEPTAMPALSVQFGDGPREQVRSALSMCSCSQPAG